MGKKIYYIADLHFGHKNVIRFDDRLDEEIRLRWESISGYAEINDGGRLVVISHYPILLYKNQRRGAIMLYGHVHGNNDWMLTEKWKKELWDMRVPCRAINVGCIEIQLLFILYLNIACFIDAMVVINIIINCL